MQKKTVMHPFKDQSRYISTCLFLKTLFEKNAMLQKILPTKLQKILFVWGSWKKEGLSID